MVYTLFHGVRLCVRDKDKPSKSTGQVNFQKSIFRIASHQPLRFRIITNFKVWKSRPLVNDRAKRLGEMLLALVEAVKNAKGAVGRRLDLF